MILFVVYKTKMSNENPDNYDVVKEYKSFDELMAAAWGNIDIVVKALDDQALTEASQEVKANRSVLTLQQNIYNPLLQLIGDSREKYFRDYSEKDRRIVETILSTEVLLASQGLKVSGERNGLNKDNLTKVAMKFFQAGFTIQDILTIENLNNKVQVKKILAFKGEINLENLKQIIGNSIEH